MLEVKFQKNIGGVEMNEEQVKEMILSEIFKTISVEKTHDLVGHKFRKEEFEVSFSFPSELRIGSNGFTSNGIEMSVNKETPKELVKEKVREFIKD